MKRSFLGIAILLFALANPAWSGMKCEKKISYYPPLVCEAFYDVAESYLLTQAPSGVTVQFKGSWQKRLGAGQWSSKTSISHESFRAKMGGKGNYKLIASGSGIKRTPRTCHFDTEIHQIVCEEGYDTPFSLSGEAYVNSY